MYSVQGFHTQTEPKVHPHGKALAFITRILFPNACPFHGYKGSDTNSAFSTRPTAEPSISTLIISAIPVQRLITPHSANEETGPERRRNLPGAHTLVGLQPETPRLGPGLLNAMSTLDTACPAQRAQWAQQRGREQPPH